MDLWLRSRGHKHQPGCAALPSRRYQKSRLGGCHLQPPEKKPGFLEWTEYADWVNDRAQLVHAAEAAIKLFYPKAKTISLSSSSSSSSARACTFMMTTTLKKGKKLWTSDWGLTP